MVFKHVIWVFDRTYDLNWKKKQTETKMLERLPNVSGGSKLEIPSTCGQSKASLRLKNISSIPWELARSSLCWEKFSGKEYFNCSVGP